jgi:myosin heavy subunit
MEVVSGFLKPLQFLQQLDLFGNPLAEESNYREYYIHHHPSVVVLDRKSITAAEREVAAKLFGDSSSVEKKGTAVAFGKHVPADMQTYKLQKVSALSESTQRLERKVKAIHARNAAAVRRAQQEEVDRVRELQERRSRFNAPHADNDVIIEEMLNQRKQQDLAEQRQLERQRLTQLLFTEAELHAIQSSFDQSKALAYTDALSIMKLMGQDDPQGRRGLKDLLADKQDLKVTDFIDLLMDWSLILNRRMDKLYAQAAQALGQGRDKEAQQLHSDINFLTGHCNSLAGRSQYGPVGFGLQPMPTNLAATM